MTGRNRTPGANCQRGECFRLSPTVSLSTAAAECLSGGLGIQHSLNRQRRMGLDGCGECKAPCSPWAEWGGGDTALAHSKRFNSIGLGMNFLLQMWCAVLCRFSHPNIQVVRSWAEVEAAVAAMAAVTAT